MRRAIDGLKAIAVVVGLICVLAVIAWHFELPREVHEISGTVVNWDIRDDPKHLQPYRMVILVETADGRRVPVWSHREKAPVASQRIDVQERIGWLGTRTFVEILRPQ